MSQEVLVCSGGELGEGIRSPNATWPGLAESPTSNVTMFRRLGVRFMVALSLSVYPFLNPPAFDATVLQQRSVPQS